MSSRHFNLESNEIHLSSTPLRGATVAVSVLGKLNIPLLLDPRFFVPMGWLALGVWPYCQTSLFHYTTVLWNLKRIPSGIQTHTSSILKCLTSWEESNLRRLRNLTLPSRERVYLFRHGKLKRSFSKVIYHGLDNTGQLLPCCFLSQRHEHVYFRADIWVALNQSQATYQGGPWSCFLTPQSISRYLWFKLKKWLGPWVIPTLSESCIRIRIALPYFGWVSRSYHIEIEQGTIWMTSPKDSQLRTGRFNN